MTTRDFLRSRPDNTTPEGIEICNLILAEMEDYCDNEPLMHARLAAVAFRDRSQSLIDHIDECLAQISK